MSGNTFAQATPLQLNSTIFDSVGFYEEVFGEFYDSNDYWVFSLSRNITFELSLISTFGDVGVQLYNASRNLIPPNNLIIKDSIDPDTGIFKKEILSQLNSGTYYIRVFPTSVDTDYSFTTYVTSPTSQPPTSQPPTSQPPTRTPTPLSLLDTQFYRFSNRQVGGTYLFASAGESVNIRRDYSDVFSEDGSAFKVATQGGDNLVRFNRFSNRQVGGTYLFASEGESVNIRRNYSNTFREEGIAFYAYGSDANVGTDYYRLANTQVDGTYLFVNKQERDSALAQFPNLFRDEGIAFEVG